MKYIELLGNEIKEDIEEIKKTIDESNAAVFIYSGTSTLYDFITALYDNGKGLDAEYLYKFKVCYENKNLNVSYFRGSSRNRKIHSMSSLINELDGKSNCRIVVETDDRVQLAFIVQQLIFIEYPLEKVDILLRKEERDADKTKRFMKNVNQLMEDCDHAIRQLTKLLDQIKREDERDNPTKADREKDITDTLNSCRTIRSQIAKAIEVELKFAVAASKKAGKSVIVNCFLGEQIAPTSTELATPNNCFYKKSTDDQYHLQLEGSDLIQDFKTRDEIYDVINGHFRNAQNNKEKGFALPNMEIRYVTDENNFSSYTIFDTAGPDAAGTVHSEVAKKAMQKCDVAVFAIDYSKYLTTSEEDYLRQVKLMFTAQNKFHSLIFALNKIDVRYTDVESPKSFIMSVDFLKTRLANIDEAYRDCIIFPICSLEYFSAIEAEKAKVTELNAENNLPIGEMKKVKFAHKDVPALAWLHTHSENLEYYHGIKTISYDVFKKDSGMPALMSYVSYVAQSKARDEIVNNITFEISAQKMKIQSVLDFISNIEALINADDEKIGEISKIIKDYTDSVKEILNPEFREDDLKILDSNSLFGMFEGNYDNVIAHQKEALESSCEDSAEQIYNESVELIWNNIQEYDEIDGNEIDNLFTTDDFNRVADRVAKVKIEEAIKETNKQLSKISREVKQIVDWRHKLLQKESDRCRDQLSKEDISIKLPQLPDFEFATKMPSPSKTIVKVESIDFELYQKFGGLFKKKFSFSNIGIWFLRLFQSSTEKDYKRRTDIDKKSFKLACDEKLKDKFLLTVYENHIAEELKKQLNRSVVKEYMTKVVVEIKQGFNQMNQNYMSCIERFSSAIDDRDQYKTDIDLHNKRKANIISIGKSTNNFMETWNRIIRDIANDEEVKSEETFVAS